MEYTFGDKKIRGLLIHNRYEEARTLYDSNAFLSIKWLGEYQRIIWNKLTLKQKKELFKRFSIPYSKKCLIEVIIKTFNTPIIPLSFTIASGNLVKNNTSFFLTSNPYVNEGKEIISYDKDNWGIYRTNIPHYGIFEDTGISIHKQKYLERLFIGSISLGKKKKKEIIKSIPFLKSEQLIGLVDLLEDEKNKFHLLYISDKNMIDKLRKKTEINWSTIEKKLHKFCKLENVT